MLAVLIYKSILFNLVYSQLSTLFKFENYPELERLSSAPNDVFTENKSWTRMAIQKMWEERERMGHTPIVYFKIPGNDKITIAFKNESAALTGSLKHRYAWALMMWALLEGHVRKGTNVYEASSGNTAISLGYMCRLVGVPLTVIVPDTIEKVKQDHIEEYGGKVVKVPISRRLVEAKRLAQENNGFFMNQFGNAYRAEEFHESGNYGKESANVFHEIHQQLKLDSPDYFVHTAGTGGTITSVGRFVKKYGLNTQVVLADTQFSIYFDYVLHEKFTNYSGASLWVSPGMAGTGFGPMGAAQIGQTTSLDRAIIDRVIKIPDIASTAAMVVLREHGISGGTSTGINFLTALHIAAVDRSSQQKTIATLLGDPGSYYTTTYLNRTWVAENFATHGGLQAYDCWAQIIRNSVAHGSDPLAMGQKTCTKGAL